MPTRRCEWELGRTRCEWKLDRSAVTLSFMPATSRDLIIVQLRIYKCQYNSEGAKQHLISRVIWLPIPPIMLLFCNTMTSMVLDGLIGVILDLPHKEAMIHDIVAFCQKMIDVANLAHHDRPLATFERAFMGMNVNPNTITNVAVDHPSAIPVVVVSVLLETFQFPFESDSQSEPCIGLDEAEEGSTSTSTDSVLDEAEEDSASTSTDYVESDSDESEEEESTGSEDEDESTESESDSEEEELLGIDIESLIEASTDKMTLKDLDSLRLVDDECAICRGEFSVGMEVRRMTCSHMYHEDCITIWLHRRPTCPLCRFQLHP